MAISVDKLIDSGLVVAQMGKLPKGELAPALVAWGRNPPKDVFRATVALAGAISGQPLEVVVDDELTKALLNRSVEEQRAINYGYEQFFSGTNARLHFSSEIYSETGIPNIELLKLSRRVSLRDFVASLPEEKRHDFMKLDLREPFHALSELYLIDWIGRHGANTLIVGQFSEAMVAMYRNVFGRNAMPAIVTPTLALDGVEEYIERIRGLS